MGNNRTRLELTWIGKENRPRLEPRVLLEDPEKSYHAKFRVKDNRQDAESDELNRQDTKSAEKTRKRNGLGDLGALAVNSVGDIFDNRLIFGDNLLALKALEAEFTGKIKCIYIDPPYNTGSAFTHYDDGVEHSLWLSLMRDRLEILRRLLQSDGTIWVQIDDNEQAYLKVLLDEVFGRRNFVGTVIWQKKYAAKSDSKMLSESHDYIVVYTSDITRCQIRRLSKTDEQNRRYTSRDQDPRGPWKAENVLRTEERDYAIFPICTPSGREVLPPKGTSWRYTKERMAELIADNRIWFGVKGDSRPAEKRFLSEVTDSMPATTIWLHGDVGHNDEAKREAKSFAGSASVFSTPKPERLVHRVITLASDQGDWVLDSFAGSGTTGAVAHKMGRRWIMVELGEHCHTHIIPRLKKVIDGEDRGGVTEATGWKGGGGFRYYSLAPSLLQKDKYGNWIISKQFNPPMLAEAICKLAGFTYAPSDTVYWQHGHSTESDFIYVTTQTMTREQLAKLSEEVGEKRTLMVYCTAFRVKPSAFPNLTLKKIPKAVLSKCEWGKDDYSLEIKALPAAPPEENRHDAMNAKGGPITKAERRRRAMRDQPTLFDSVRE